MPKDNQLDRESVDSSANDMLEGLRESMAYKPEGLSLVDDILKNLSEEEILALAELSDRTDRWDRSSNAKFQNHYEG